MVPESRLDTLLTQVKRPLVCTTPRMYHRQTHTQIHTCTHSAFSLLVECAEMIQGLVETKDFSLPFPFPFLHTQGTSSPLSWSPRAGWTHCSLRPWSSKRPRVCTTTRTARTYLCSWTTTAQSMGESGSFVLLSFGVWSCSCGLSSRFY